MSDAGVAQGAAGRPSAPTVRFGFLRAIALVGKIFAVCIPGATDSAVAVAAAANAEVLSCNDEADEADEADERSARLLLLRQLLEPTGPLDPEISISSSVITPAHLHEDTLRYRVGDGAMARALLLRPTTPGPHPAVLLIHGHDGRAEELTRVRDTYHRALGVHLAAAGFVVLAPDVRSFGAFKIEGQGHNQYARNVRAAGDVYARLAINDARVAFHVLQGVEGVDPDRIGIAGLSLGGFVALVAAAAEPEIRAVVVSGLFLDWNTYFSPQHHFCQHFVALLALGSSVALAADILPRPLQIHWGERDSFAGPGGGLRNTEALVELARERGLPGLEVFVSKRSGHAFDPLAQLDFFQRHLERSSTCP
ncbi:MAG: alpha/beta fold hydrolase [Deltaproteobacteria bacterium]|nr:alpha/beta fold hydrolase [Deltaproteobacteria bacterium]